MQRILNLALLLLAILCLPSCNGNDDCYTATGISGEWQWTKSIGGFAGSTRTPDTENETRKLVIDDFQFQEFVNGELIFESAYDLEMRTDSAFGTNKFIIFENGGEIAYLLEGNRLELYELCADCFTHFYTRK